MEITVENWWRRNGHTFFCICLNCPDAVGWCSMQQWQFIKVFIGGWNAGVCSLSTAVNEGMMRERRWWMQARAQNQFILRVYLPAEGEQLLQHTIKKCCCSLSLRRFPQFLKFSFLVTKVQGEISEQMKSIQGNLELGVIKAKVNKQSFQTVRPVLELVFSVYDIIVLHVFLISWTSPTTWFMWNRMINHTSWPHRMT